MFESCNFDYEILIYHYSIVIEGFTRLVLFQLVKFICIKYLIFLIFLIFQFFFFNFWQIFDYYGIIILSSPRFYFLYLKYSCKYLRIYLSFMYDLKIVFLNQDFLIIFFF